MADVPSSEEPTRLSRNTWNNVVKAIEEAIPVYDEVNDAVSFGKAQLAREFAIQGLSLTDGMAILDSGVGPGTTSKLILKSVKPGLLVGFDGSAKQLRTAKRNLHDATQNNVEMVRGSFESLPFRGGMFNAVITCYALRDSLDVSKALEEYGRVCTESGVFADVDIGKPDNLVLRSGSSCYVRYLMPLIAKTAIIGRIKGNPWRMIAPTYKPLPTNGVLLSRVQRIFRRVEFKSFLMGGIIVIMGIKPSS